MSIERDRIFVVDFGSQFTELIVRKVRELGVYSEVIPWHAVQKNRIEEFKPKGVILSGSSHSVLTQNSPRVPEFLFNECKIPILGLCYGMQVMVHQLGGKVKNCHKSEFGSAKVELSNEAHGLSLFENVNSNEDSNVWMSHGDQVSQLPDDFQCYGSTTTCPYAVIGNQKRSIYGFQFHIEVNETIGGKKILENFLVKVCDCRLNWRPDKMIEMVLEKTKEEIDRRAGDGDILLALSGGVDSSVVAAILQRVVGERLKCVLVDTGLLRKGEVQQIKQAFAQSNFANLNMHVEDARERFLKALEDVEDPEQKRSIVGRKFIEVFESVAKNYTNVKMLAQGTIYPDVIESAGTGCSALIKSHHNVGGLPEKMNLAILEPVRTLFKDEVRVLGELLGLSHGFVWRHPFPGPGMAVRILGKITQKRVEKLQHADAIFLEELHEANYYYRTNQAFAVLLECKSVAVKGDGRCYDEVVALRAVQSVDFMTARTIEIPFPVLQKITRRICNEVHGVSRVVFDLTEKPPATIEWE